MDTTVRDAYNVSSNDLEFYSGITTSTFDNLTSNVSSNWSDYYYYYYDDDDRSTTSAAAVALAIVRYVFPFIVAFGTAGNVLSAVVLVHRRLSGGSIDLYRVALAVVDTTVLYVSAFKTWIRVVTGVELLHASDAACRCLTFILLAALHLSAWLIVLLAVDRFMTVWCPFRAAVMCSMRGAFVAAVCLLVIVVIGNVHAFWTFRLSDDDWAPRCVPAADDWFMNVAFNYVKFSTYSFLPFVVVAVLNVLIIYRLVRLRRRLLARRVRRLRSRSDAPQGGQRVLQPPLSAKQVRATSLLVVVALMWLVLATPFTLVSVLAVNGIRPTSDSAHLLVKTFAFVLMYMNHSVNVIVYCAMERRFRTALCRTMLCYGSAGQQACDCCRTRRPSARNRTDSAVKTTMLLSATVRSVVEDVN